MIPPVLFGATYSVYVRAVRLALDEKGVAYRLEAIDIFADGGPPPDYRLRHPFLCIPAFEHDGFALYEAGAIMRYVDAAFDGPPLMPATPRTRARNSPTNACPRSGQPAARATRRMSSNTPSREVGFRSTTSVRANAATVATARCTSV